jgi:hypothetical protein
MIVSNTGTGVAGADADALVFHQAQAGDQDSVNVLMARHTRLVPAVVRRQVLGDLPFGAALQASRVGLWRAILGFDPERGCAFSTYAWPDRALPILAENRWPIPGRKLTASICSANPPRFTVNGVKRVLRS